MGVQLCYEIFVKRKGIYQMTNSLWRPIIILSSELDQKKGLVHLMQLVDSFKYGRQKIWMRFPSLTVRSLRVSTIHIVKPPFFIKVFLKL